MGLTADLKHSPDNHSFSCEHYLTHLFDHSARIGYYNQQASSSIFHNSTYRFEGYLKNHNDEHIINYQNNMSDRKSNKLENFSISPSPENSHEPNFNLPVSNRSATIPSSHQTTELTPAFSIVPHFQQRSMNGNQRPNSSQTQGATQGKMYGYVQQGYNSYLNHSASINPQHLYAPTLPMYRSASPATTSSYERVQSASPYQQPARLAYGYYWQPLPAEFSFDSDTYENLEVNEGSQKWDVLKSEDEVKGIPYNELLFRCLSESEHKEMCLKDIYQWFIDRTNKRLSLDQKGWQNSVRHNLSMNEAFRKGCRTSRSNSQRTMWCLTDEAITIGKVYPTTRYRKNTDRPNSRSRPPSSSSAPRRKKSGARGSKAARRSSARLRYRRSSAAQSSPPSSAPITPYFVTPQVLDHTFPAFDATSSSSSRTMNDRTTYDLDYLMHDGTFEAPYYSASTTPSMSDSYLESSHHQEFINPQGFTSEQDMIETQMHPEVYMAYGEHQEQQPYYNYTKEQLVPYQFQSNTLDNNGFQARYDCNRINYMQQAMHMQPQETGAAAPPISCTPAVVIDPNFLDLSSEPDNSFLHADINYNNQNFASLGDFRTVPNKHDVLLAHDKSHPSSDGQKVDLDAPGSGDADGSWDQDLFKMDEEE